MNVDLKDRLAMVDKLISAFNIVFNCVCSDESVPEIAQYLLKKKTQLVHERIRIESAN